jgi:hypothetical protein
MEQVNFGFVWTCGDLDEYCSTLRVENLDGAGVWRGDDEMVCAWIGINLEGDFSFWGVGKGGYRTAKGLMLGSLVQSGISNKSSFMAAV